MCLLNGSALNSGKYHTPPLYFEVSDRPLSHIKEASALLFGDIKGTDRLFRRAVRAKQMSVALIDGYRGPGRGRGGGNFGSKREAKGC